MSKKIADPKTREKLKQWIRDNVISPESLDYLDVEAEFGTDLTFDETIRLAVQKFPGIWKVDPESFEIRNRNRSYLSKS